MLKLTPKLIRSHCIDIDCIDIWWYEWCYLSCDPWPGFQGHGSLQLANISKRYISETATIGNCRRAGEWCQFRWSRVTPGKISKSQYFSSSKSQICRKPAILSIGRQSMSSSIFTLLIRTNIAWYAAAFVSAVGYLRWCFNDKRLRRHILYRRYRNYASNLKDSNWRTCVGDAGRCGCWCRFCSSSTMLTHHPPTIPSASDFFCKASQEREPSMSLSNKLKTMVSFATIISGL